MPRSRRINLNITPQQAFQSQWVATSNTIRAAFDDLVVADEAHTFSAADNVEYVHCVVCESTIELDLCPITYRGTCEVVAGYPFFGDVHLCSLDCDLELRTNTPSYVPPLQEYRDFVLNWFSSSWERPVSPISRSEHYDLGMKWFGPLWELGLNQAAGKYASEDGFYDEHDTAGNVTRTGAQAWIDALDLNDEVVCILIMNEVKEVLSSL